MLIFETVILGISAKHALNLALAIELMAILLRASPLVRGIPLGSVQEKIPLYADDTLLYLRNKTDYLGAALSLIDMFGRYSSIWVNWGKSVIFGLHPEESSIPPGKLLSRGFCNSDIWKLRSIEI